MLIRVMVYSEQSQHLSIKPSLYICPVMGTKNLRFISSLRIVTSMQSSVCVCVCTCAPERILL